jgi:predicted MPP superfamily phosphohydrolase
MLLTSLATLAGISILSKGYWNTFRPELKNIEIDITNSSYTGDLKILHLTDIHIEKLSVKPEKVIEMVGNETFDLIALTGDYLDRVKSIEDFLQFLRVIVTIPTRLGIYAVWGNHDWVIKEKHLAILQKEMENLGVVVLSNESKTIEIDGHPIHIIGIDDHYSGHSDADQAFNMVPENGTRVVLTHDPLIVNTMLHTFDYLICGHFHSGQIYYPLPIHSLKMGLKPLRKYLNGLQFHFNGTYYISGGLGQTGANLRLGCRPEVTIHTLKMRAHKKQVA